MKLLRIGVANFRSIGAQPVVIDLTKRINLLIGANNAGKSGVLEILTRFNKHNITRNELPETDRHRRDGGKPLDVLFEVEATDESEFPGPKAILHLNAFPDSEFLTPFDSLQAQPLEPFLRRWKTNWSSSGSPEDVLREKKRNTTRTAFVKAHQQVPEIHFIPQFRQILKKSIRRCGRAIDRAGRRVTPTRKTKWALRGA